MNAIRTVLHSTISIGIAAIACTAAFGATERVRAQVVGVHPESWSSGYVRLYDLPAERARSGRFAVAKLLDAPLGKDIYVLVHVPQPLALAKDAIIEIGGTAADAERYPGRGTVAKVVND